MSATFTTNGALILFAPFIALSAPAAPISLLAQMKKIFLEVAMEFPLWDGAASLAQNLIALLSVIFGIALMFTLIVVYGRRG